MKKTLGSIAVGILQPWKQVMVCLMTACCMMSEGYAQEAAEKKIAISFSKQKLVNCLEEITAQTGVRFYYEGKELDQLPKRYTIDFKNRTLSEILNNLLTGTGFSWQEVNGKMVIRKAVETSARKAETNNAVQKPDPQQVSGKVSGKILDEADGHALIGATVIIGGKTTTTDIDGTFMLSLPEGHYDARITHIGYGSKEVTDISVVNDQTFLLTATLKREKGQLSAVLVKASARKESVNSLLIRQKNAAEVSNGISAEQISRTPDKNIGESLKRISGVSSIDNKFVLVRGIGERYNAAMLDGIVLPSTEAQTRNFSFDLIPANLVDNVVVSKTVTPDMNVSFGGGLIQISTRDIPNENFMNFTAGVSYNDQSTGEDFLSHKRGKNDYLGFDDGRRKFPGGLEHTDKELEPNRDLTAAAYAKKVTDQSRKFTNDNFSIYKYRTAPSQNYQFTIGRLITADTSGSTRLGFTGSISYRNTQNINIIDRQIRGSFLENYDNPGAAYSFNTTWGSLLNVGLQIGKHRFSFRNIYTRMYDNTLVRIVGYDKDNGNDALTAGVPPNNVVEADDPTYLDLLQNKLGGQHLLGKIKIEWDAARTSIRRKEMDLGIATSRATMVSGKYQYFYVYQPTSEPKILPISRHYYDNREISYSWDLSGTLPFQVGAIQNSIKAGYFGNNRNAGFDWQIAGLARPNDESKVYLPISEVVKPENLSYDNGFHYNISQTWLDAFEGSSRTHAFYAMNDTRLLDNIRLVWGIRAEYYKFIEEKNGASNVLAQSVFNIKTDRRWEWLPSANLTYSPINQINFRAAFSSTVVRPEMMDNSRFWRYSPYLGAQFGSNGLYSTRIKSVDLKAEWYPGAGEIISVGGFYKKFDKPAELVISNIAGNLFYYLKNASWANVYGLEFELRKKLGFIGDVPFLNNLTLYGNLTLQQSKVLSTYEQANPDPDPDRPVIEVTSKQSRPMYGQSPYLINAGLQYTGRITGFNIVYNRSGYKTYIVSDNPKVSEFERPREQLDAQISFRPLKKIEVRLNAGNLLNSPSVFYRNDGSYENNPDYDQNPSPDISNKFLLRSGFTNKYEEGDVITFRQRFGRTYSFSITYNF